MEDYDFDQDELYVDLTYVHPVGTEPENLQLKPRDQREETEDKK